MPEMGPCVPLQVAEGSGVAAGAAGELGVVAVKSASGPSGIEGAGATGKIQGGKNDGAQATHKKKPSKKFSAPVPCGVGKCKVTTLKFFCKTKI